jgi:hypothetical protein
MKAEGAQTTMKKSIRARIGRTRWSGLGVLFMVTALGGSVLSGQTRVMPAKHVDALASGFQSPPDSAKPLAYWWWLNGHTDTATITSDLEAMRSEGYGGAILMDANGSDQGGNIGVAEGPMFGTPAWQELFCTP